MTSQPIWNHWTFPTHYRFSILVQKATFISSFSCPGKTQYIGISGYRPTKPFNARSLCVSVVPLDIWFPWAMILHVFGHAGGRVNVSTHGCLGPCGFPDANGEASLVVFLGTYLWAIGPPPFAHIYYIVLLCVLTHDEDQIEWLHDWCQHWMKFNHLAV